MFDPKPILDRHKKIALQASGGKDSRAVIELLKDELHRICIYHVDTGDQLPEQQEAVAEVEAFAPHFVRIRTDSQAFVAKYGFPTDLLPYSSHPIGHALGQDKVRLTPRYDCCAFNLMEPLLKRTFTDGNTLVIRGVKKTDTPNTPWKSGEIEPASGMELYLPIYDWTDADVFTFLAERNIDVPLYYNDLLGSADCAHCSAWWSEGRGKYLKKRHPAIYAEYQARLRVIFNEIGGPLASLREEMGW